MLNGIPTSLPVCTPRCRLQNFDCVQPCRSPFTSQSTPVVCYFMLVHPSSIQYHPFSCCCYHCKSKQRACLANIEKKSSMATPDSASGAMRARSLHFLRRLASDAFGRLADTSNHQPTRCTAQPHRGRLDRIDKTTRYVWSTSFVYSFRDQLMRAMTNFSPPAI